MEKDIDNKILGQEIDWSQVNFDEETGCIIREDGTRIRIRRIIHVDFNDENDLPF